MKKLTKWSRILHRDIGFFFMGMTIIYALSGIAFNHISDWNPNYSVSSKAFTTKIDLNKNTIDDSKVKQLIDEVDDSETFKKYYYPKNDKIKIFLKGGSSIVVNTKTGKGNAEFLKKRPIFYQVNFLHYNPHFWWKWFSDLYAVSLIMFVITGIIMVKGKKGIIGRGGIYALLGIAIPILFLIFL